MKKLAIAGALAASSLGGCAATDTTSYPGGAQARGHGAAAVAQVAPGMARYSSEYVDTALWERPGLAPRDRSIVTVSALISRNQLVPLEAQLERALGNGVTPAELSELITHIAFYAGWGNATGAAEVARRVFERHGVRPEQLPAAAGELLPLDEKEEADRAAFVSASFGEVSPGVVENTTRLLFRDAWLRPGLAPRDKSLVTVSSLVAAGQIAQVPVHLNKGMNNGLTQAEASEMLTQLAFYAGWPNVFSALPVFKDVFAKRSRGEAGQR
ncbi:carboxymuconolactone decarboxylase family protein [Bordetella genomosp. 1]|nr:carboxymuconolactone decarboxylase family protein [Bordetella genomosp. 1]